MSLDQYVITGRLAENGQLMHLPVVRNGKIEEKIIAGYFVQGQPSQGFSISDSLLYYALPAGTKIELGPRDIPIPFKDGKGNITDVRRFQYQGTALITDGTSLVKINPGVPFSITAPDGAGFHAFEHITDRASNPQEERFPFVYDEKERLASLERGSRIIQLPGVVIFPDYAAFRLPGWLAKEFNGSPEFGFAYSEFTEPRKGEILHAHQEIMEPYIGLRGEVPLFVATNDGSTQVTVNKPVKEGDVEKLVPTTYRGEIVPIRAGDVVIPLPNVPHRIQFDGAQFPFTMYCVSYADRNLNLVPGSDRVVLEK